MDSAFLEESCTSVRMAEEAVMRGGHSDSLEGIGSGMGLMDGNTSVSMDMISRGEQ
jgi:hypothetical protein